MITIAVVFEIMGAFFLGTFVSKSLGSILVVPTTGSLDFDVSELMLAMISVSVGSGTCICIATILSLPVSTTHSVISSFVGYGLVLKHGVISTTLWKEMIWIMISWVASPLIGSIFSIVFWFLLKKLVITSKNPVSRMLTILPFLSFVTLSVLLLFVLYRVLYSFNLNVRLYLAIPGALFLSAFCSCFIWKMVIPEIVSQMTKEASKAYKEIYELNDDLVLNIENQNKNADTEQKNIPQEKTSEHLDSGVAENIETSSNCDVQDRKGITSRAVSFDLDETKDLEHLELNDTESNAIKQDLNEKVENDNLEDHDAEVTENYVFSFLVVFTSACIAMAHGANDISNASVPLNVIVNAYVTRRLSDYTTSQMWVTFTTTTILIFGLVALGYRVMKTVGFHITKLSPARAFVAQLSAATIILTCSLFGLPLSTTQIVVGCIYGINIVDLTSIRDLNWKLALAIFSSWVCCYIFLYF